MVRLGDSGFNFHLLPPLSLPLILAPPLIISQLSFLPFLISVYSPPPSLVVETRRILKVWLETPIECRALSGEFGKRPSRKSKRNARWKRLAGSDYESGDNVTGILVQVYNAISKVYRNVAAKG